MAIPNTSNGSSNQWNEAKPLACPIIFVGVADGIGQTNPGTIFASNSIFELSYIKSHFVFPAIAGHHVWCFLGHAKEILAFEHPVVLKIMHQNGTELAQSKIDFPGEKSSIALPAALSGANGATTVNPSNRIEVMARPDEWVPLFVSFPDLLVNDPGEYQIMANLNNDHYYLGHIIFAFSPPHDLTEERIGALEADPASAKLITMTFGCKICESKLHVYAAVRKTTSIEKTGGVFYKDLPDEFVCSCGQSRINLTYVRQGLHGFLGRAQTSHLGVLSHVQRYARSTLLTVASEFLRLVDREREEPPIQQFLEANKVLFARFHAKKLFVKPTILGKFFTDFAVLDSENNLVLIEIERPSIPLFKKNGHPTAEFNHAYEQVLDWLHEYTKHRHAVLDGLELKADEVLTVRGCVIAGRRKAHKAIHLQRHMTQPRHNVEFLTLDMLGEALIRIANDLFAPR